MTTPAAGHKGVGCITMQAVPGGTLASAGAGLLQLDRLQHRAMSSATPFVSDVPLLYVGRGQLIDCRIQPHARNRVQEGLQYGNVAGPELLAAAEPAMRPVGRTT